MDWKTSLIGIVPVLLAGVETFLSVDIPGFSMSLPDALAVAGVAWFAADAKR